MHVSLLASQLKVFGADAVRQVIVNGHAQQAALHLIKSVGFNASVVETADSVRDDTRDHIALVLATSRIKAYQLECHPYMAPDFLRENIHPDSELDEYYPGLVSDPDRFMEFLVAFGVHGKVALPDRARISVAQYVQTEEINFDLTGISPIVAALFMSV